VNNQLPGPTSNDGFDLDCHNLGTIQAVGRSSNFASEMSSGYNGSRIHAPTTGEEPVHFSNKGARSESELNQPFCLSDNDAAAQNLDIELPDNLDAIGAPLGYGYDFGDFDLQQLLDKIAAMGQVSNFGALPQNNDAIAPVGQGSNFGQLPQNNDAIGAVGQGSNFGGSELPLSLEFSPSSSSNGPPMLGDRLVNNDNHAFGSDHVLNQAIQFSSSDSAVRFGTGSDSTDRGAAQEQYFTRYVDTQTSSSSHPPVESGGRALIPGENVGATGGNNFGNFLSSPTASPIKVINTPAYNNLVNLANQNVGESDMDPQLYKMYEDVDREEDRVNMPNRERLSTTAGQDLRDQLEARVHISINWDDFANHSPEWRQLQLEALNISFTLYEDDLNRADEGLDDDHVFTNDEDRMVNLAEVKALADSSQNPYGVNNFQRIGSASTSSGGQQSYTGPRVPSFAHQARIPLPDIPQRLRQPMDANQRAPPPVPTRPHRLAPPTRPAPPVPQQPGNSGMPTGTPAPEFTQGSGYSEAGYGPGASNNGML